MKTKISGKGSHYLSFAVMLLLVALGIFLVHINPNVHAAEKSTVEDEKVEDISATEETSMNVSENNPKEETGIVGEQKGLDGKSGWDGARSTNPKWVWNEHPDTVDPENNIYGGAKTWKLSEDLEMHMCWCYGIRVTKQNSEIRYNGDNLDGHFVWSRDESNDLVLTDYKSYIAVHDYDNKVTSTFAVEGSRAYRFDTWSAYFFSDGEYKVTDSEGTVTVMQEGLFQIDPLGEDWRFSKTPEELIAIDQNFMKTLLLGGLPWQN